MSLTSTKMEKPDQRLLDGIIDFADDNQIPLAEASEILLEHAKQRLPALERERAQYARAAELSQETCDRVGNSKRLMIMARVLIRTRVRYIFWPYYPEYQVVEYPREFWWCPIRYEKPDWDIGPFENRLYLDDLFHDPYMNRFWMPEPYLCEIPASKALFDTLMDDELDQLPGTHYIKVDPILLKEFREERAEIPDYIAKECESDDILRKKPYGSDNWKSRIEILPLRGLGGNRLSK